MEKHEIENLVEVLLQRKCYSTVFQPIVKIESSKTIAFEALLRGPKDTPFEKPSRLFNEKGYLGEDLLLKLDLACIDNALSTGTTLPEGCLVFINIHAVTLKYLVDNLSDFLLLLDNLQIDRGRVVFELSERTEPDDITEVESSIRELRKTGVRLALDDTGVIYPSFKHIFRLEPEYLKVDRSFISGIDTHQRKQSMVHGLSLLSGQVGCCLIAEGVENEAEWLTVGALGVPYAQGFYLGRPMPVDNWLDSGGNGGANVLLKQAQCREETCSPEVIPEGGGAE